jgi:putative transcriptional regulator
MECKEMGSVFDGIKQGLDEVTTFAKGKKLKALIHDINPVDVKNIRANIGMSQNEFANAFGISVNTLRHWERGDRYPQRPSLSIA